MHTNQQHCSSGAHDQLKSLGYQLGDHRNARDLGAHGVPRRDDARELVHRGPRVDAYRTTHPMQPRRIDKTEKKKSEPKEDSFKEEKNANDSMKKSGRWGKRLIIS